MKIIQDFPPNIADIASVLDIRGLRAVFTYGDELYNPTGGDISEDLMAHEETHAKQQAAIGKDQWWAMYLTDEKFRLKQEAEAYQAQYGFARNNYNRDLRRRLLAELARGLSSKMYGNIINKQQAKEIIENG